MIYTDFDLLLERAPKGFRAQVLTSSAGQASVEFELPFSDVELENFLLKLGRTTRLVRRIESTEMTTAKSFGGALFNAVFAGDVRACFRSAVDEARRENTRVRLRLRLADPVLADLPWEFLYNPAVNRFLALSVQTPLVRYMELPDVIQPVAVTPPIRVLVMISSPTDYPSLDVEAEWKRLNESLADLISAGTIAIERLDDATLSALQRRLRRSQYHIFHFIGHGEFDQTLQEGVLLLERDNRRGHRVGSQYLGMLLHDHDSLRLAILNACEGARTSRQDPFAGSAQSLVQQGIPAVIAMQFEIADDVAGTFAHEFYGALADGLPIDAAVTEARKRYLPADVKSNGPRRFSICVPPMAGFSTSRRPQERRRQPGPSRPKVPRPRRRPRRRLRHLASVPPRCSAPPEGSLRWASTRRHWSSSPRPVPSPLTRPCWPS
jgi:hypothetical protein